MAEKENERVLNSQPRWQEKELDKTPVHVPYVASYHRRKTENG